MSEPSGQLPQEAQQTLLPRRKRGRSGVSWREDDSSSQSWTGKNSLGLKNSKSAPDLPTVPDLSVPCPLLDTSSVWVLDPLMHELTCATRAQTMKKHVTVQPLHSQPDWSRTKPGLLVQTPDPRIRVRPEFDSGHLPTRRATGSRTVPVIRGLPSFCLRLKKIPHVRPLSGFGLGQVGVVVLFMPKPITVFVQRHKLVRSVAGLYGPSPV